MTKELTQYAFNSGDVRLQVFYSGDDDQEDDQKSQNVTIPINRLKAEVDFDDGATDGILEITTAIYDENIDFLEINKSLDFFVYPKKWTVKDPIISCYDVEIMSKRVSISPNNVVLTQYVFSNRPGDTWKEHRLELPDNQTPVCDPNALWRMVRALEGIQKTLNNPSGDVNPLLMNDMTLTVKEYSDLVLKGILPERYRDVNKEA